MWFAGYPGKVADAGSMARSARHFDLALATTEAVARKSAARIFTGVCVGRGEVFSNKQIVYKLNTFWGFA